MALDPFENASNALAEALHTNYIEQITKVTARLSDKDDYIRNRVFNMAKAKLRILTDGVASASGGKSNH